MSFATGMRLRLAATVGGRWEFPNEASTCWPVETLLEQTAGSLAETPNPWAIAK